VIVARLFSTHEEFAEFSTRNTSLSSVPAAFFSASLNAIVLYDDENDIYLRQTVFHECSHQFLNRYAHDVPKWLNEGLAEYFEGWRISAEGKLLEKRVSLFDLHLLQDALRRGKGLPLETLVAMEPGTFTEFRKSFPDLDPYLHYATSWGFVYASLDGANAEDRERILRCLSDLNRTSHSDAYRGVDWSAIQARFERTILALKAGPRDALDHVLLARGFLRSREWQRALEHYESARKADPKMRGTAYWIGYLYKWKGEAAKAVEWLERAREEAPADPSPIYQLARIVGGIDRQNLAGDPARGLALAQEASKAAGGDDPFYLFFVAECQAHAGDRTKALVTARKALKLVDEEGRAGYEKRFAELEKRR
jgi:tetratricopeptide (TPR) repeat protein